MADLTLVVIAYLQFHRSTKLKKLLTAREELFLMVAHDLRVPIAAIKLASDLELTYARPKTKNLETIRTQTIRMEALLTDLLLSESAKVGELSLKKSAIPASTIVDYAIAILAPFAREKGVQLVQHVDSFAWCQCDPERIKQVLLNLIDNAIKHGPNESTVNIRVRSMNETLLFSVENKGVSIDASEIKKIFEPYYRSSSNSSGYGLGLFIVKMLVEAHHGKLWIDAAENTFRVYFTLKAHFVRSDGSCA